MNNQNEMGRLTAGLKTKSDKIRALGRAGYPRQQIADFLGIRYQHVRNVLVDAERLEKPIGMEEPKPAWRSETPAAPLPGNIRVQTDGSVLIPASILAGAGVNAGDRVIAKVRGDGEIQILTRREAIRRVQERMRTLIPAGVSLVDEFLAEKRREVAKEEEDFQRKYRG
jgi:bifunctional DNA-binding transcriptional regulator/antitoxin component of YhaV-PrlF toxin-antitoxin module